MHPAIGLIIFIILLVIYKARKKNKIRNEDDFLSSFSKRKRVKYPKATGIDGRRKSTEERKQDLNNYLKDLAQEGANSAKSEKIKQSRIGVTHYIWRSSEDSDVCQFCKKNNGKKFSWKKPPLTGHPGEGTCCPHNLCRCYPEAVIK